MKDCESLNHTKRDGKYHVVFLRKSASGAIGYVKGKSAISIARNFTAKKRNFTGELLGPLVLPSEALTRPTVALDSIINWVRAAFRTIVAPRTGWVSHTGEPRRKTLSECFGPAGTT
jgi:hypothetical protein